MKNKPTLGIDVDLTVVDTDLMWLDYIGELLYPNNPGEAHVKAYLWKKKHGDVPYNLSELFSDELQVSTMDLKQFWRSETLYDVVEPKEGVVEALRELSETFDIVFCSAHKGWHARSKFYFLDKWFTFHSGVILTKEKWKACGGWWGIIDDRVDILNKCIEENPKINAIQYPTHYSQDQSPNWMIQDCGKDWTTIAEQVKLRQLIA